MNWIMAMLKNMNKQVGTKGQIGGVIAALVGSVAIAVLLLIVFSVSAGQTYESSEDTILAISNLTVRNRVNSASEGGFNGLVTLANNIPVFVSIAVVSVIILLVGFGGMLGGGGGRSTPL